MKCSNCGMDNIQNDAVHCPHCGASLITTGTWTAPPVQEYHAQTPPAPAAAAQHPQPQPEAHKHEREAIIRNVNLTEILVLFSGILLIVAGFDNLGGASRFNLDFQYTLLGIFALLFGLAMLGSIILPSLLREVEHFKGFLMLIVSLLFLIWGFAATFADNVGYYSGVVIGASLAGLAAAGLKLGMLK